MHLNKVEIRFGMYQFHTLVVLFFTLVMTEPAPVGSGHSLPDLGSLTTQLLAQLISLLLRPFGYGKLQEDPLPLVELRRILRGQSIPFVELIHWRTGRDRGPVDRSPIHLDGSIFHPKDEVRWLGYWFTPSLSTTPHFTKRLAKAQAA